MAKVFLVCGVPGSGKSWVLKHFVNTMYYDHHFNTPRAEYAAKLAKRAKENPTLSVIADCPLGISEIVGHIRALGVEVEPVFIIAPPEVVAKQYFQREGRCIPKQHLGRIATIRARAVEYQSFSGDSDSVLKYLIEKRLKETD
jgi:hypothetical protein